MKPVINNTTRSILVVSAVSFATIADAATISTTLNVTADVVPTCSAVTTQPVVFGDLNSGTVANGSVDVTCPSGLAYNIALDAGLFYDGATRFVGTGGTAQVRYLLFKDAALTDEWGDSGPGLADSATYPQGTALSDIGNGAIKSHTVYGEVLSATTTPGAYADVVNVTVHF